MRFRDCCFVLAHLRAGSRLIRGRPGLIEVLFLTYLVLQRTPRLEFERAYFVSARSGRASWNQVAHSGVETVTLGYQR